MSDDDAKNVLNKGAMNDWFHFFVIFKSTGLLFVLITETPIALQFATGLEIMMTIFPLNHYSFDASVVG